MPTQHRFENQLKVKMTLFSNAAWKQRVRIQVPERRSATLAGPGPNLPSVDRTFEGAGEGDRNFGTLEVDTGYDGALFTILCQHSSDGGRTWHESRVRTRDSSRLTLFLAEDSSDGDYNDTIIKSQKNPYFT